MDEPEVIGYPVQQQKDDCGVGPARQRLKVSMKLHQLNRERLCHRLTAKSLPAGALVILQGGDTRTRYCTDIKYPVFRQDSYFHWLFGVSEPGFYGTLDVDSGQTVLFAPRPTHQDHIYTGQFCLENFKKKYAVDKVYYVDELYTVLKALKPSILLTLYGLNTDSGRYTSPADFPGISDFSVDSNSLHSEITECRVFKTDYELDVLRYIAAVSCDAHKQVMKAVKPGLYEYQCESLFIHAVYSQGGARCQAFTPIACSGHNCSVMHYGHAGAPNNKLIQDGDMCLLDMGGEYYCYASDITCSYPANGKFTADQKMIYNAVLAATEAVEAACKPGVYWPDMHWLAFRVILTKLKEGGLVKGDVEEMMKVNLGAVFMPAGLGHFLGLDFHDVGGYPQGTERINKAGLRYLRTTRRLEERMVLTVEPGIYFIEPLLNTAFEDPEQSRFLVKEEIDRFRGTGGVRIEDEIVITADGMEVLTPFLPRTVEDIEQWMAAEN